MNKESEIGAAISEEFKHFGVPMPGTGAPKRIVIVSENCEGQEYFECVVDVPSGMNLEAERAAWWKWYREEYCPDLGSPNHVQYRSLLEQLLSNGCKQVDFEKFVI